MRMIRRNVCPLAPCWASMGSPSLALTESLSWLMPMESPFNVQERQERAARVGQTGRRIQKEEVLEEGFRRKHDRCSWSRRRRGNSGKRKDTLGSWKIRQ